MNSYPSLGLRRLLIRALSGVAAFAVAATACTDHNAVTNPGTTRIPPTTPMSQTTGNHWVTTNGVSSGNGNISSPWNLHYAIQAGRAGAGDTLWIEAGTYTLPSGGEQTWVVGASGNPVVIRNWQNGRAIIDGVNATTDNFIVKGDYSTIWGLEFTNSSTASRQAATDVSNPPNRPNTVINHANFTSFRNLIIHDGGVAFFSWMDNHDVQVHGCIFYNNGWDGPSGGRGHGHAIYLNQATGYADLGHNVVFNQFGYGIHIYRESGTNFNSYFDVNHNTGFNNGSLSNHGTSANIANVSSGSIAVGSLVMIQDRTYFGSNLSPAANSRNLVMGLSDPNYSGNTLDAPNDYVVGGGTSYPRVTPALWQQYSSITNTTSYASLPTSMNPDVFIEKNWYESGRASIIIYNGRGDGNVTVDLSSVLSNGDPYYIRNVQRLFDTPVMSGTYSGPISIPMAGVTPYSAPGWSKVGPTTGPYFQVFLVTKY